MRNSKIIATFRRIVPHLVVMVASICAYYFYHSRTQNQSLNTDSSENASSHLEHKDNHRVDVTHQGGKSQKHQQNKSTKCNPTEESLKGKKYANAGCLVVQDGKILLVHRTKKGAKDVTQSAIPGGRKNDNELSPCTAQRRTFELTGVEVVAIKQIMTVENGFVIFLCEVKTGVKSPKEISQSGKIRKKRISSKISFEKPSEIKNYKYLKQLEQIKKYLAGAKSS